MKRGEMREKRQQKYSWNILTLETYWHYMQISSWSEKISNDSGVWGGEIEWENSVFRQLMVLILLQMFNSNIL